MLRHTYIGLTADYRHGGPTMDFSLTADQQNIRDAILKLCSRFPDEYWLRHDREGVFPQDFFEAMRDAGWLGIAMPSEFGGGGLGITEAAVMMQAIAESGAGMSGASAVHIPVFSVQPVVLFGTQAQKQRILPAVVSGEDRVCFAVTEPNAGLNTTEITTRADRRYGGYVENGDKNWISTAQVSNKMLLLARTTPLDQVKRKTHGLSLFYTDFDRAKIEVRLIHKMGRHAVDSNMLFIHDLWVRRKIASAPRGRGSRFFSTASTRSVCSSRQRPSASVERRSRARPATRVNASCSTGRSA